MTAVTADAEHGSARVTITAPPGTDPEAVADLAVQLAESAHFMLTQTASDDLRVRIHRYLRQHPGLTTWETAAALKATDVKVRDLLYVMQEDGEAVSETSPEPGGLTRWTAT